MKFTLRSLFVLLLVCASGLAFGAARITGVLKDQSGPIINGVVAVTQGGLTIGNTLTDFDGNYTVAGVPAGTYEVTFTYLNFKDVVTGVSVPNDGVVTVNRTISTAQKGKEIIVTGKRYEKPLVDFKGLNTSTKTAADLEHLATTNLNDAASLSTGTYQARNGGAIAIAGARSSNTTYIVDGVMLKAGDASFSNQPQGSVDQLSTYSSGIPARYGDATGGIITITTKGITPKLRGGLRAQHSVDGYNSNLLSVNLAGPIWSRRDSASDTKKPVVGFTLDAQGEYNEDDQPTYNKNYVLKGSKLNDIQQHPLTRLPSTSGTPATFYSTESVKLSDLEAQKKRPNTEYYRGQLNGKLIIPISDKMSVTAGASINGLDRASYDQQYTLFASSNMPRQTAYTGRGFVRFTQKFASAAADSSKGSISNASYTIQADYQKDYSTTQDKNHKKNTFDYGYVGKFQEILDSNFVPGYDPKTQAYGVRLTGYRPVGILFTPSDINPELAAYTSDYYNITPTQPTSLLDISGGKGLRNGDLPTSTYDLWRNVGYGTTGWSKTNSDQVAVTVDAAFDYKIKRMTHSVEFGLYYQQRNERYYNVNGASLWSLMRLLTTNVVNQSEINEGVAYVVKNGVRTLLDTVAYRAGTIFVGPGDTILYDRLVKNELQGAFDRNLRAKLGKSATDYINVDEYDPSTYSLNMFSPDELQTNGLIRSNYYGYDWMGNRETGSVNFNDYWTKKDATGAFYTRPIGAYRPNYIAGYLSDYITFKDFRITLGVRVERFDANTKVLKDPYSLVPVRTVSELTNGTSVPNNIGSDYVVYVGENTSDNPTVIGYRNGDTWYDAKGNEVQNPVTIKNNTGSANLVPWLQKGVGGQIVNIQDTAYRGDKAFTDYKPQVNVSPRINFSFPLSETAQFFAHYDVVVQRPTSPSTSAASPTNYATPMDYYYLQNNPTNIIGNPDLKPEKMIDYKVGFQQAIGKNSAVTIEAFYKGRKDQIQLRSYYQAYPTTYYTYGNRDFSTYKGFSLAYDLRRLGQSPISMQVNYTLSFNEGTGSSAASGNGNDGNTISGSGLLANYIASGIPNARNLFPLTNDSRHNLNATVDYRYREGEGPVLGSSHFLENAGASLIFRTRSGEPYTKYINPSTVGSTGGQIEGGVNSSRLPWHYMFDLNVDKDFVIHFGKKAKTENIDAVRTGGLRVNVFAYVQNLLNTKDILTVYGYTGSPTDDGYLTSAQGMAAASQKQDVASYKQLYNLRTQDVNYLNSPRTIVLGLKLNF